MHLCTQNSVTHVPFIVQSEVSEFSFLKIFEILRWTKLGQELKCPSHQAIPEMNDKY